MLGEQELEEFFAHIDEISQDSTSSDHYQQINKLKSENSRLKVILSNLRSSTREVLEIVKNERKQKLAAQQELERSSSELESLRRICDDLDKRNLNNEFQYKETVNELEIKHRDEHEDYIELSKDYFNLLSEATTFYNFEIKRDRNKILCKTSRFLEAALGDTYKKPKLIVKRSSAKDSNSTGSKRKNGKNNKSQNAKRKKIDIWEMKSISEANSPMSYHEDTKDEISETESECSFKTFSIGNETAFSSLANRNINLVKSIQCTCRIESKEPDLVSIGVNTDDSGIEMPMSMPSFIDDDVDFSHEHLSSSIVNNTTSQGSKDVPECKEFNSSQLSGSDSEVSVPDIKKSTPKKIQTKSIGIATEESHLVKQTKDQSTSSINIEKSNKSTYTVHSVTHRGTMTPGRVTRNIGIQFPDITFEKILEEMSFDLPNCISPIIDETNEVKVVEKSSTETQTNLQNVNREIYYIQQNTDEKKTVSNEEQSFIILGKTVFNLFMNRLKKNNKLHNDDAQTRQRIREQLLYRFDELTFDEYFSPTFVALEAQESVLRKVFEDVNSTKCHNKKADYEAKPVQMEVRAENASNSSLAESTEKNDANLMYLNLQNVEAENVVPEKAGEESIAENIPEKLTKDDSVQNSFEELDVSPVTSQESIIGAGKIEDLEVSSESSSEEVTELNINSKENLTTAISSTSLTTSESSQDLEKLDKMEVDEILQLYCPSPRKLISPIADLTDLIWSSVFPPNSAMDTEQSTANEDSPLVDENVLSGYDVENEPIEIPLLGENGIDCPYPPPDFTTVEEAPYEPINIPLNCELNSHKRSGHGKALEFNPSIRFKLVTWQQNHQLKKIDEKRLYKIRKSITNYLNSDWTDENLEKCMNELSERSLKLLVEAIFETVEDNQWQREINLEFTPPAPPLPRYQQKLIVLISKLSENHQKLPHELVNDLEMKLFKCENSSANLEYLRNMAYYYSSLIDLFFNGDPTIVFYFIIKCIYFYGYKAIPMVFVLIKAFPLSLPKKSNLLKKYSTNIDWEKMSGLEMSKIRLDLEWMDSLDLSVMYILTDMKLYHGKGQEFKVIYKHELFNYLPKIYGFPLGFMKTPKMLLDIFLKRLEDGELNNLSMSLILLGKRMYKDFTLNMMLKGKLLPLLKKYVDESLKSEEQPKLIDKICVLIESISTILKPLTEEKDKIFNEIFPLIVNILGRSNNQIIQEYCIKAILRLQRFIKNHKEIYEIIKHHYEKGNSFSESLQHSVVTFVHRKKEAYWNDCA